MTEIHGGTSADYVVSQATITPYVIACPTSQIRDAIVQQGIYTIPDTPVFFTVHEWRPRFGMGYDPPTHQIWIRIVGLPLQAWTVSEVTAFIQHFGYPMHIMPFGRAAGHYRDITALVATRHPATIPLAYRYREGDYSAQVDILFLAWRTWEDTHFPPPPHLNGDDGPPFQPQNHNDPTVSVHHSSSSSSNDAPSEPTIDYSCWSPRSYRLSLPPHFTGQSSDNTFTGNPLSQTHTPAAKNQNPLRKFRGQFALLQTLHRSIHRPICIKPFSFFRARNDDGDTLGGAQEDLPTTLSPTVPFVQATNPAALTLANLFLSPPQVILRAYLKEKWRLGQGPKQPTKNTILTIHSLLGQVDSELRLALPHQARLLTPAPLQMGNPPQDDDDPNCSSFLLISNPEVHRPVGPPGYELPRLPVTQHDTELTYAVSEAHPPTQVPEPLLANMRKEKRKKAKLLPTRRSQRIQAKHPTDQTASKFPTRNSNPKVAIDFNFDEHETPLDNTATLAILQATGLQINNQIQQMIEDAVRQNQNRQTLQQDMPTTPLHDQIPPLAVAGSDLLL